MEPKRILVVDDNVHLQLAYKKRLTSAGYQVQLASNGEEGLRLALETAPDAILLDMLMPKLGGVEVLRALKRDPVAARIPVIAVSSLPQSNELRLREEGAVNYLQKSDLDDSGALLQAVAHALLRRGSNESHPDNSLLELPHHSKTSK
jgi:CheY-like chemotaxis protein